MKKILFWIAGIFFLLACQTLLPGESAISQNPAIVYATQLGLTAQAAPPVEAFPSAWSATDSPMPTFAATSTFSPSPTLTASPTATLELIRQGPDSVTVPILLYHRIEVSPINSQYYVPPEQFEEQMALLHHWGYTTITLDDLQKSIYEGADLPARPLLLTFDDGQTSVHDVAFPIMQKYGFRGVVYIVGTYMDAPGFMTTEQVKELADAGWEVGSHSMKHRDLTKLDYEQQVYEIFESRKLLSEKIGAPVNSFAYPWGGANGDVFSIIHNAGYTTAMGLGYSHHQSKWNILLLQRRDVKGTYDLKQFAFFLPWQGDAIFLPTNTPTPIPTSTRTPRPTKAK